MVKWAVFCAVKFQMKSKTKHAINQLSFVVPPWTLTRQAAQVPAHTDTKAHTAFLTCKKTAESLWYKLTNCRLAMVSITPMALPAMAKVTNKGAMWRHSGMTANTREMMRVEEKRADSDEHSLLTWSNTQDYSMFCATITNLRRSENHSEL